MILRPVPWWRAAYRRTGWYCSDVGNFEIVNGVHPFFFLSVSSNLFFRAWLAQFAAWKVTYTAAAHNFKIEVDPVASTSYSSDDWAFGLLLINMLRPHNLNINHIISTWFPCTSIWPFHQGRAVMISSLYPLVTCRLSTKCFHRKTVIDLASR